jgi:hypothetical protein
MSSTVRDECLVEVAFVDGHVRAVLAVEHERKGVAVLDAEQHERGQPFAVDAHVAHVAAFALERLGEKAAHVVVADPREHRGPEPEPRAAERDVRRRSAEVLREARHILEPRAHLLRIEIDGEPAETHDVAAAARGKADF